MIRHYSARVKVVRVFLAACGEGVTRERLEAAAAEAEAKGHSEVADFLEAWLESEHQGRENRGGGGGTGSSSRYCA